MGHGEPAPMGLDMAHPPIHGCHDLIALNTFKFFLQFQHLGGICSRLVLQISLKNNSVRIPLTNWFSGRGKGRAPFCFFLM